MALAIAEGHRSPRRYAAALSCALVWLGADRSAFAEPSLGGLGRMETGWINGFGRRGLDPIDRVPVRYLGYGGLTVRGMVGAQNAQFAAGLDLALGGTSPAGFFYAFVLRPGGVAFVAGDVLRFTATGGVGFDGATPTLPVAGRFPMEALLELRLGEVARLELAGEFSWLVSDATRDIDSLVFGVTAEGTAAARFRLGTCCSDRWPHQSGSGTFVGFVLTERAGTWLAGSVLGHSFDMLWLR